MSHLVGTLGRGVLATVGPDGSVEPVGTAWRVDWWTGAEDRWHLPAHETAVRQRRIDGTPVIETAMRVPGGDVVQRVYGAVGPGRDQDVVVVDVLNDSAVPIATAFAVRGDETGASLRFSRPPAGDERADGLHVYVLPVAHRTSVRVVLDARPDADASAFPAAGQVAAGWHAQVDRGIRVDVPDPTVMEAVVADRTDLLLRAGDGAAGRLDASTTADLVGRLDREGFTAEAAALVDVLTDAQRIDGSFGRDGHAVAAAVLEHARLTGTEADVVRPRRFWPRIPASERRNPGPERMERAGGLRLVADPDPSVLEVLLDVPAAWYGQSIDVHDAPTRHGLLSFGVRWHGDRPALLWELQPWPDAHAVTLTAPGLDPAWSTTEPRGEALLAAPGLRVSS